MTRATRSPRPTPRPARAAEHRSDLRRACSRYESLRPNQAIAGRCGYLRAEASSIPNTEMPGTARASGDDGRVGLRTRVDGRSHRASFQSRTATPATGRLAPAMADWTDELRAAAPDAPLPPLEGELLVPGLREPVEVLRDHWGIPYLSAGVARRPVVRAGIRHGLRAAVPDRSRAARGERAAVGAVLRADARAGPLRARGRLQPDRGSRGASGGPRHPAACSSASSRASGRGSAAMPAPPVEYALLAVPPTSPSDLGAWAAAFASLAWGLSGNWDSELLRVHLAERLGAESRARPPPPAPRRSAEPGRRRRSRGPPARRAAARPRGQGSNSWVVAGSRTASGRPLLANDPHLLVQQPARVVRAPPAGARVRGPRRRVPVRARHPGRRRRRTTPGGSRT